MDLRDRFRGSLLAGAVGDALGAGVEFKSRQAIVDAFGEDGVRTYVTAYGRKGAITDDTQMLLFTAEGLLRARVRGSERGFVDHSGVVANAYIRWLRTQGITNPIEVGSQSWLFGHQELHSQRAPGNTCLSALREMKRLGEPAKNTSKGCGTVMRIAPVGLFVSRLKFAENPPERAFKLGVELSALTHGHPTGSLSGGALALMIYELTQGRSLREACHSALKELAKHASHEETTQALQHALRLADSDTAHVQAVAELGLGWIAEEALAISVYCALVSTSILDGLSLAVSHSGDSDSTGAITGNLMGILLGESAIPPDLLAELELKDLIAQIAEDLYAFPDWQSGRSPEWQRYPGC